MPWFRGHTNCFSLPCKPLGPFGLCFPQVTEAQLAAFFSDCGQLVDCRMCVDPNSSMRFAFIEFLSDAGARQVRRAAAVDQTVQKAGWMRG